MHTWENHHEFSSQYVEMEARRRNDTWILTAPKDNISEDFKTLHRTSTTRLSV